MTNVLGITTTVPVELAYAAGRAVVDLNNAFVADADPLGLVEMAERSGFPQGCCAWIKGIYGVAKRLGVREVIGVVQGDCSDGAALLEILESEGVRVHPFAYPHGRRREDLEREVGRLAESLGTTITAGETCKQELDAIRKLARAVDTRAWGHGDIQSAVLSESLLALTDFQGDPGACRHRLAAQVDALGVPDVSGAMPRIRLGIVGVPPILTDLWDVFEACGARFVFHEIPRQFALLDGIGLDLVSAYQRYTYPYDFGRRLDDICQAVASRQLAGLVHYVQTFCHRQIHDRLLRERVTIPILGIEGDRPGPVDARTRTRIEAFLEQIRRASGP